LVCSAVLLSFCLTFWRLSSRTALCIDLLTMCPYICSIRHTDLLTIACSIPRLCCATFGWVFVRHTIPFITRHHRGERPWGDELPQVLQHLVAPQKYSIFLAT
jgi:hypothetical protein